MANATNYDANHQLLLSSELPVIKTKKKNFYLYKLNKSNVTTTLQQTLQNLKQFTLPHRSHKLGQLPMVFAYKTANKKLSTHLSTRTFSGFKNIKIPNPGRSKK